MLSTKNIITDLSQIPEGWIFEYYLNTKEKLTGQDIKLSSVFNIKDKIPSLFVYMNHEVGSYRFKDFSSGNQGDAIELVMLMYNLPNRGQAVHKIMLDYEKYTVNYKPVEKIIQKHDKFKVTDYEMRHWNTLDKNYWLGFNIGSALLAHYRVIPLAHFTMEKKEIDGSVTSFTFNKPYMYGYFRKDGSLYKIYLPKNLDKKFIKVENYIQGSDQLTWSSKYLIINSSLKDIMGCVRLGIGNLETVAPDSEGTMIGESNMKKLMEKYKVIVLFDNDGPGLKAAEKYETQYGVPYIQLDMEKDLSDSIKKHGVDKVKNVLFPLIKKLT